LTNYHNEIDNATNFLNQIMFDIIEKSKATLNCLQYTNVTIEDTIPTETNPPTTAFAKSKERPHECDICKKSFFTRDNLKSHIKSHQDERPYQCDLCNNSFKTKYSLNLHKNTHTDDKPWKCEVCGTCFKQKHTLLAHKTAHTGVKPFECQYCHMKFYQKGTLRVHMIVHSNPNRYKCPYENCGKAFSFNHHLKSHVKIHTGIFFSFLITRRLRLLYQHIFEAVIYG